MAEPNRTPGKAEGTEEQAAGSFAKDAKGASKENASREPGRTPGKAEGTVEDVERSLRNQEQKDR